jgi:hypothetical protein
MWQVKTGPDDDAKVALLRLNISFSVYSLSIISISAINVVTIDNSFLSSFCNIWRFFGLFLKLELDEQSNFLDKIRLKTVAVCKILSFLQSEPH